ncbi:sensor histidine kinase [Cellulomonas bogoriensis]|uniref:histidine kinase n=1 Tax=Cellulomonas bogoriensis 69B4 = DSM 16987 TaxID=1386082 RepID=A0A0A0C0N5_9CELL|nr:histidine kinase [Cellulomonas bogoriensis]KGM13532.1 histidine kinase [Cellulomonas bogoriensis 69B4 = DSM 16987]
MHPDQLTAPGAWWDARLTRLGVRGPLARDALLAVTTATLMAFVVIATVRLAPPDLALDPGLEPWFVGLAVAQSLVLVLRRVHLGVCVAVTVGAQVVMVAFSPEVSVRNLSVIVVAATIGTTHPAGRALRGALAVGLVEAFASTGAVLVRGGGAQNVVQHSVSALLVWVGAALVGTYLATRRDHLLLVQERAVQLERERDTRVRAAVTDERARLARELHDVAAHHLSGMVVQAAAVERLVDRDPDAARAGAVWLRDQGRETLDNLRQVVGLLREDHGDDVDGLAPVPGVSALDHLVRTAQDLGDDVTLDHTGDPVPLPPLADVSVFRVAQQAVTNARQHSPGAAVRVHVAHEPGAVVLTVRNGPSPSTAPPAASSSGRGGHGGVGLAVMRERAALVAGELETGPTDDGGWQVRLRVPVADEDGSRS